MLVSGAEAADWARWMHRRGLADDLRIDRKELIAFKRPSPIPYQRRARRALRRHSRRQAHALLSEKFLPFARMTKVLSCYGNRSTIRASITCTLQEHC
jgi:hypothetical protein